MTREEAYKLMQDGNKITQTYFADWEYYFLKDGKILAEDGTNHTEIFHSTDDGDWRKDNWSIYY